MNKKISHPSNTSNNINKNTKQMFYNNSKFE